MGCVIDTRRCGSRKDSDTGSNDPLDQKDHWTKRAQHHVNFFRRQAHKLGRYCKDSRSHDLTEPIESILRIPEANNPPNAPASGEQTDSPSQTH